MKRTGMSPEVNFAGRRLREASVADRALVGTFSGVNSDVLLQSRFLGEVLSTGVASVGRYHL